LGKPANLCYLPAGQIWRREPARFGLLREITAFHGAYDSSKARRDVPEFTCEIPFGAGAAELLADVRRRNAWKTGANDSIYDQLVEAAQYCS